MDIRLLLVCPDQDTATVLMSVVGEMGMEAEHTPSIAHGLERLGEQKFDAIVFEYRDDEASQEFLAQLRQSSKNHTALLIAVVDEECNARPLFWVGREFCSVPSAVGGEDAGKHERGTKPDEPRTAARAASACEFDGECLLSGRSRSGRDAA